MVEVVRPEWLDREKAKYRRVMNNNGSFGQSEGSGLIGARANESNGGGSRTVPLTSPFEDDMNITI